LKSPDARPPADGRARGRERPFAQSTPDEILDVRPGEQKERLYGQKEAVWGRLGYSSEYLSRMRSQAFWEEEAGRVEEVDRAYRRLRGSLG